jgi:hypothetical protein
MVESNVQSHHRFTSAVSEGIVIMPLPHGGADVLFAIHPLFLAGVVFRLLAGTGRRFHLLPTQFLR